MPGARFQREAEAVGDTMRKPNSQEADIQTKEDATKARNFSADIMKESRRVRKQEASRNSLVKMSLGLMSPGMWQRSTSFAWMLSWMAPY